MVEEDENTASKAYCTWQFILGIMCMTAGTLIHVSVLPFLDLTLIAVNATLGIIISVILSTAVLKEAFIVKYDLAGLLFITAGCTLIVLNANKESTSFSGEEAIKLLLSTRSLIFIFAIVCFIIFNNFMINNFIKKLRLFEADVDRFQTAAAHAPVENLVSSLITGGDEASDS